MPEFKGPKFTDILGHVWLVTTCKVNKDLYSYQAATLNCDNGMLPMSDDPIIKDQPLFPLMLTQPACFKRYIYGSKPEGPCVVDGNNNVWEHVSERTLP